MSDYKKLSPEIFNAEQDNLNKLAGLFPSAVKDGMLDFEALKEELGQFEDVGAEKYELTWAGKQNAKKAAQTDVAGRTLKFVPEDSKDADTTQNLYIEGDNLEVLKLLRQNYYGAVKMIYIDPPYNTGNDFVYRDDFSISKAESDEAEGETVEGERMVVNQKSNNRYHANWLNMMYPRLKVAKDLLRDDGVIFISIDDNEVENFKKIGNEVFGEDNFVAQIIWERAYSPVNLKKHFSESHDYIICYAKNIECLICNGLQRTDDANARYENLDNDIRGEWKSSDLSVGPAIPNNIYEITTPSGRKVLPPSGYSWRLNKERFDEFVKDNRIWFGTEKNNVPSIKRFLSEVKQGITPMTIWKYQDVGHSQKASQDLKKLFDNKAYFTYPKPIELIKRMLILYSEKDSIILDFFSGSATTAHAVMQLNAEDGGNRKFIMVQFPEITSGTSNAHMEGYYNICEIGKERIRRAGEKIKEDLKYNRVTKKGKVAMRRSQNENSIYYNENPDPDFIENPILINTEDSWGKLRPNDEYEALINNFDFGFKVFRTAETNIRWTHDAIHNTQLDFDESSLSDKDKLDFMPGYTDIDVVYEILLRQRDIPLSSSVEKLEIGNRTYLFADAYVVCLDETVTREMVEKLAAVEPTPIKHVFRDSAFDDDISLKDETVRRLQAYIARNSGEMKKAYTVEFI